MTSSESFSKWLIVQGSVQVPVNREVQGILPPSCNLKSITYFTVLQKGFLIYFYYDSNDNSAWLKNMEQEIVGIVQIHSFIYSLVQNYKINSEATGLCIRSLTVF